MPYLKIQTNIQVVNADKLMKKASARLAEILEKNEDYVMVCLEEKIQNALRTRRCPLSISGT